MTADRHYTLRKPEGLLAHYTSAAVAFEDILPTGKLRMSPYRRMKDPAENKDIVPSTSWRGDRPNPDEAVGDMIERIRFVGGVPFTTTEPVPLVGDSSSRDWGGGVREPVVPILSADQVVGHFLRHGSPNARRTGDGWETINL